MTKFVIEGGRTLQGSLEVFGAKNACLPIICATALADQEVKLTNIPALKDIELLVSLLKGLGCIVDYNKEERSIKVNPLLNTTEIGQEANKMRASILLIAPLLAKKRKVKIPYPGGCSIGGRPIDITLDGLRALGVEFEESSDYIIASTEGLKGADFTMHFPSVGATEALIMAASRAKGETILRNVAKEPEVVDTINFLNAMGAKIDFIGDRTIKIEGVDFLHSATHKVIPDRIITGTYAIIGALCAGDEGVRIENCSPKLLHAELSVLEKAGVKMEIGEDYIYIPKQDKDFRAVDFSTSVYDGFATDLQAPMMMFLTQAKGVSRVTENIYENRFMHVEHLNNMSANIDILSNKEALINGGAPLCGKEVSSTDLRASAALIIAGLVADGQTVVDKIEHLDRGYESLDKVLQKVGANLKRISD